MCYFILLRIRDQYSGLVFLVVSCIVICVDIDCLLHRDLCGQFFLPHNRRELLSSSCVAFNNISIENMICEVYGSFLIYGVVKMINLLSEFEIL